MLFDYTTFYNYYKNNSNSCQIINLQYYKSSGDRSSSLKPNINYLMNYLKTKMK